MKAPVVPTYPLTRWQLVLCLFVWVSQDVYRYAKETIRR